MLAKKVYLASSGKEVAVRKDLLSLVYGLQKEGHMTTDDA